MATSKPTTSEIATQLAALVTGDLVSTLAILAGMLGTVRENDKGNAVADARFAADALRLELNKWRLPPSKNDTLKALREAGAAAATK
jgi:hypothetical protein